MLTVIDASCPYCGETIELHVDASAGDHRYVEDCHVCCRPIEVAVVLDEDDEPSVRLSTDSDG